jgi:hypothetical protein
LDAIIVEVQTPLLYNFNKSIHTHRISTSISIPSLDQNISEMYCSDGRDPRSV